MSQRLFTVPKIGLFLDSYAPSIEKRKGGEEVKILTLTLRLQPFDSKLAAAIDDGLSNDAGVKTALFKLTNGEPKPHLRRIDFNLACPRQNLVIFASSDTVQSRITLEHAKISGTYARTQKDINGYAFVFKAALGPVGRGEQEYIHEWLLGQRFVTFEEAEPSINFEDEQGDPDQEPDGGGRPEPMFGDDEPAAAMKPDGDTEKARVLPMRGAKKGRKKVNPEAERAVQKTEGAKRAAKKTTKH
jgi:hypothetical protein